MATRRAAAGIGLVALSFLATGMLFFGVLGFVILEFGAGFLAIGLGLALAAAGAASFERAHARGPALLAAGFSLAAAGALLVVMVRLVTVNLFTPAHVWMLLVLAQAAWLSLLWALRPGDATKRAPALRVTLWAMAAGFVFYSLAGLLLSVHDFLPMNLLGLLGATLAARHFHAPARVPAAPAAPAAGAAGP